MQEHVQMSLEQAAILLDKGAALFAQLRDLDKDLNRHSHALMAVHTPAVWACLIA